MSWHRDDYAALGAKIDAWIKAHPTVMLIAVAVIVAFFIGKFLL